MSTGAANYFEISVNSYESMLKSFQKQQTKFPFKAAGTVIKSSAVNLNRM